MYHYKISRDGKVWWTRDLEDVVWAEMGANRVGLAVCVDATKGQDPTVTQVESLGELLAWLGGSLGLSRTRIFGHGELTQYGNSTSCPGPDLTSWCRSWRGS